MGNLAVFLRMQRAVAGGVTSRSARHLELLARTLAAVNGRRYITPGLVKMAARKVWPHRVELLADPARERSVQYGSDPAVVAALLSGVTTTSVVEDVLAAVEVPV